MTDKLAYLRVPSSIASLLQRDRGLHAAALASLVSFEGWTNSELFFFPEYTDHGPEHISAVLETAANLVTERSWPGITPSDAAILIISILLHDSAMHLTGDGFMALISGTYDCPLQVGEMRWPELWEDFLADARRWPDQTLTNVFGTAKPIQRPPASPEDFNLRDRQLIGEFLRRYHARLAHEIGMSGVPGPGIDHIRLQGLPGRLCDLAGWIARSHGFPFRSCLDHLVENFNLREFQGVHAVFLMALLRVADYLQIQADRAPAGQHLVYRIRSPLSQRERDLHRCVENILAGENDPEAIRIDARPTDIHTFARLRDWLDGIQAELDVSWAVLGEVYGRFVQNHWNDLGLSIRRVRSNLDNPALLAKHVPFYPLRVTFRTATSRLLTLLISPLYGDTPAIGIRELIQNAVDAVLEQDELVRQLKAPSASQEHRSEIRVTIEEKENGTWLTVADLGIGMTPEVVRDYFLNVGASFRGSDAWRALFEDEAGRPTVRTSGRFGIGCLTAFLLGDHLEVDTCHSLRPNEGISFKADLNAELIQLDRINRPHGTAVRIRLRPSVAAALKADPDTWRWYWLDYPRIALPIPREDRVRDLFPECRGSMPIGWNRLEASGYEDVQWSYTRRRSMLTCNGLRIWSKAPAWQTRSLQLQFPNSVSFSIESPTISVFDRDGHFPLNLQRTSLVGETLPFQAELRSDLFRDFLAYIIIAGPRSSIGTPDALRSYFVRDYPGAGGGVLVPAGFAPLVSATNGFTAFDPGLVRSLECRSALVFMTDGNLAPLKGLLSTKLPIIAYKESNVRLTGMVDRKGVVSQLSVFRTPVPEEFIGTCKLFGVSGMRVGLQLNHKHADPKSDHTLKELCRELGWSSPEIESRRGLTVFFKLGIGDSSDDSLERALEASPTGFAAEWYFTSSGVDSASIASPLYGLWVETIGSILIRYDVEPASFAQSSESFRKKLAWHWGLLRHR